MVCVCRPAWTASQTSTASHSAAPTSGRTGRQEKNGWPGGYPGGGLGRAQSENHDVRGLESALARLQCQSLCPGHSMPVSAGFLVGVCQIALMHLRSTAQVQHSVAQHTRITQCQLVAIWVTRTILTHLHSKHFMLIKHRSLFTHANKQGGEVGGISDRLLPRRWLPSRAQVGQRRGQTAKAVRVA